MMKTIEANKFSNEKSSLDRALSNAESYFLEVKKFEAKIGAAEFGIQHPDLLQEANRLGQVLPTHIINPQKNDLLFIVLPKLTEGEATDKTSLFTWLGVVLRHGFYGGFDQGYIEPLDLFNRSFEYFRDLKRRAGANEDEISKITSWQAELYGEFINTLPDLGVKLH